MIVYTIGNLKSYDRRLAQDSTMRKVGRRPDYPGGSVWLTKDRALAHLRTTGFTVLGGDGVRYAAGVYEVEIKSMAQLSPERDDCSWRDLLEDAVIVRRAWPEP